MGANLYGYPAMKATYLDKNGEMGNGMQSGLEQLLDEILASNSKTRSTEDNISVIAVLGERHHSTYENDYCQNYWLQVYRDSIGMACNHSGYFDVNGVLLEKKLHDDWFASMKVAAKTLSIMSKSYGNVMIGYTIDDFGRHVLDVKRDHLGHSSYKYSTTDVSDLVAAGKSCKLSICNENFQFWPTLYMWEDVAPILADGHILGYDWKSAAGAGDQISVDIKFKLIVDSPFMNPKVRLSFFYSDGHEKDTDSITYKKQIFQRVIVNDKTDAPLLDKDIWGKQFYDLFDEVIEEHLHWCTRRELRNGECKKDKVNKISIGLVADGATDGFMNYREMNIWNVELTPESSGTEIVPEGTSYTVPVNNNNVFAASISPTGDSYSIANAVDGALVFFPSDHNTYDSHSFEALIKHTKTVLGEDRDLILGLYATLEPFDVNIRPELLREQFDRAKSLGAADGVMFYGAPFRVAQLETDPAEGLFAERKYTTSATFNLQSYWAGLDERLEGWFHRWRFHRWRNSIVMGGYVLVIKVQDQGPVDFEKSITDLLGNVYYRDSSGKLETSVISTTNEYSIDFDGNGTIDDTCTKSGYLLSDNCPGFDEVVGTITCARSRSCSGDDPPVVIDELTISTDTNTDVLITYELVGVDVSEGTTSDRAYWNVQNLIFWEFESGIHDPCYEAIYHSILDAFLGYAAKSVYDGDADGDKLRDCTDPDPLVANNWLWVNAEHGTTNCSELVNGLSYMPLNGNAIPGERARFGRRSAHVEGVMNTSSTRDVYIDCSDPTNSNSIFTLDYGILVEPQ